jgi:ribonuclease P protein component
MRNLRLTRLKSKNKIEHLFREGNILRSDGLLLRFHLKESLLLYAGVAVSKRNFKRAVDRNRIKRQLRESIKVNASLIPSGGHCMLIYTGKKRPLFLDLKKHTALLFSKLNK